MPQTIPLALTVAEKAFREFRNQWLSGLKPILSLETASDGQIHVTFKVIAGDATSQHESVDLRDGLDEQERSLAGKASVQHRRRSPSYRRRLLRRAAARAAADDTATKSSTAVKFVQTEAENNTPYPDPVLPCIPAVEAEQQPQHHPQYLPQDEVCSDESYAESLALPQLDGHNDSDVPNNSSINLAEFSDIIKNQENARKRDTEESETRRKKEREADMEQFRKLLGQHLF